MEEAERLSKAPLGKAEVAQPLTPEEIEARRVRNEEKRVAAVKASNERRYGKKPEVPKWKKSKPGRIVALCGWRGW